MLEKKPPDGSVTEEGASTDVQEVQPAPEQLQHQDAEAEEDEDENNEEQEKVRRFRRCQRRKKIRPISAVQTLMIDIEEEGEEDEEEDEEEVEQEDEEDDEEDEESQDDVTTISEYESVLSAVQFEWEDEVYEFLDLCDPGTMDSIYNKGRGRPSYDTAYGQITYLEVCSNLGVSPIVRFYNALLSAEADLSSHGLDSKQMCAVAKALEVNPNVETLILKGNLLSSKSCQPLSTLLARTNVITDLDLSSCKIGPKGAEVLASGLQLNESLKNLNLTKCYIEDEGMRYLAIPLKENNLIEKIILSWNNLSGEAAIVMGSLFEVNNKISHLDLDYNYLYEPSSMKIFFKGLGVNNAITYLTLKWNGLSLAEIGEAVARFLKANDTIKCLDLSDNRIYGDFAVPLRKGLAGNQSLEILRLARNPLTSEDVEFLLPGVKACRTLRSVDLQDIWVEKEFVQALKRIKLSRNVDVLYGGVYSDYTIAGPDYPAVLLKRARYEGLKPKKAKAKREFGNLLVMLDDKPITAAAFMEQVVKFKAKINMTLISELIKQYLIPKVNLVDVVAMRQKYLSTFPDFKPPEKPKTESGETKTDKDKHKKRSRKNKSDV